MIDSRHVENVSYKLLVESIKDYGIYMLDPDGVVVSWNSGAKSIKGYEQEEIVGRNFALFYTDDDRQAHAPARNLEIASISGRYEGEGWRLRKDGSRFWAHVVIDPVYKEDVLVGFAKITRDRTEYNKMAQQLSYMARYDALTGLPNRVQFVEEIADFIRQASLDPSLSVAVINIDLDRFKEVNDGFGHKIGDKLLQRLASRMLKDLGSRELIGRFSGDEFVAALVFKQDEELHRFLVHLQKELTRTVRFDGFEASVGASLGVSVFPKDADGLDQLLANADLAMYRAKKSFEQKLCFYETNMDELSRARRAMARDIIKGLESDQFFVVYQVQKAIETGDVTGYEALLRWNHPILGLVSPSIFIPIAEENGSIIQLGDWVLETVCNEAGTWEKPYKVAVNLSPVQLGSSTVIERVEAILCKTGLSPSRLELEVTESAIILDKKHALNVLERFRDIGIGVALDDFGVGYSSFETLRSFPFNKIKIDRSFVSELDTDRRSAAFVRAILALGDSLGVPVLAEGVETQEQACALSKAGCLQAQGFFYGYPQIIKLGMSRTATPEEACCSNADINANGVIVP